MRSIFECLVLRVFDKLRPATRNLLEFHELPQNLPRTLIEVGRNTGSEAVKERQDDLSSTVHPPLYALQEKAPHLFPLEHDNDNTTPFEKQAHSSYFPFYSQLYSNALTPVFSFASFEVVLISNSSIHLTTPFISLP